jgi:probable HAF family extracellular repeat protein
MHAFVWSSGAMTDLGTLGGTASVAWAINNAGTIVGESLPTGQTGSANYRAFIYQNQQITPLPTLGGSWSVAYDINESGVIAGLSYNALQREQAVTWSGGVITNIAQAGGATDQRTRGYGINDAGAVAGWGYTPLAGPNNAFRYSGGQWLQIGGFGQFQNSEAYDIGNSGIVVGSSAPVTGGDWHAAVWLPANPTQAVILGTLPGFPLAELDDLNGDDHAVGRAYIDSTASRAIYYDGTALSDLNDFLPPGFKGELIDAREINEGGAIAATARHNGVLRAVLLTPQGIPGDLDNNGVVDINDLLALIGQWGPCPATGPCPADLDGDQQVEIDDLLTLIGNWG